MADLYLGSGYRCQKSIACSFRVMPASGEDQDLDEAARARRTHEERCRFRGLAESVTPREPRTMDERRDQIAAARVELEDRPAPVHVVRTFHVRCAVCGEMFTATGPRAMYCSKPQCQQRRSVA